MLSKLFVVGASLTLAGPASASDFPLDAPVIEHAELVPAARTGEESLFLTIANPGPVEVAITSIQVSGYAPPLLIQSNKGTFSVERDIQRAALQIPAKADLAMSPSSLFLQLDRLRGVRSPALVYVHFANGTIVSRVADSLEAGATPTDHHHGAQDSERRP